MGLPTLVMVTGMPSSGKTTVAEALARRLRLPLIAKDDIKESLYESLGADDVASSGRLGVAAYELNCDAPLAILLDRYAARTRHAGHHDAEKLEELPSRFASGTHAPLSLDRLRASMR